MAIGFDIKSQKIIGSLDPKDGKWAIPYEYEPDEENLISQRGRLYLVVGFEGGRGVDLHLASKILIDSIREHYYGDLEGTPLQALETSLVFGKDRLTEVVNKEGVLDFKFNVACCVVWDSILYVAGAGETACLLLRGGEVLDISHKTSGEVMTSSGILENEDVIILATSKFVEEFSNETLVASLSTLDKKFTDSPNSALLGCCVIRFKKSGMPSKKDLAGIVNLIKFNKKNKQQKNPNVVEEAKNEIKKEPDQGVITSIYEEEKESKNNFSEELVNNKNVKNDELPSNSANLNTNNTDNQKNNLNPGIKDFATNTKKRGRKTKHLLTGLFVFALVGIFGFTAFKFYSGSKNSSGASINAVSLVDKYSNVYEGLIEKNAPVDDYKLLIQKIESDTTLNKDSSNSLIEKINQTVLKLQSEDNLNKKYLVKNFTSENSNSNLNKVSTNADSLLISDKGTGTIFILNAKTGEQTESLALSKDFLFSFYSGTDIVVIEKNKIFTGSSVNSLKEYSTNEPIDSILDAYVYFDNIYYLGLKDINKLSLQESTYTKSLWSSTRNENSLVVNGSIFTCGDKGITKYFKGEKEEYLVDTKEGLSNCFISANEDASTLYVLANNNILYVNEETGAVNKTTNITPTIKDITSFVVSDNNIYLLTKTSLYKIPLSE